MKIDDLCKINWTKYIHENHYAGYFQCCILNSVKNNNVNTSIIINTSNNNVQKMTASYNRKSTRFF